MKDLIHVCIFNDIKYIYLSDLLIESIIIFTKGDIDILIYTSSTIMSCIKLLPIIKFHKSIYYSINDNYNTRENACCARLDIFDIKEIKKYKRILYLEF